MRDSVMLTNMTRGWAIPRCCLQAWAPGNCKLPTPGHWNIKSERDQHEAEYIEDPESLVKSYRKDTTAWTQMSIRESNRHMLPKEGSNLGERFPSLLWFLLHLRAILMSSMHIHFFKKQHLHISKNMSYHFSKQKQNA